MRQRWLCALAVGACVPAPIVSEEAGTGRRALRRAAEAMDRVLLVGIGDSLTHGTMDATNVQVASQNAYLQKVADKLGLVTRLRFRQPFYDIAEKRLQPWTIPTNLGVDGADVFSIDGLSYHERAGTTVDVPTDDFLADQKLPSRLKDDYDKVLFPINLLAGQPVSQIDAAVWQLTKGAQLARAEKAVAVLWIGNNDSSGAALGTGGTPDWQPIPFEQIASELPRGLRLLMRFGQRTGQVYVDHDGDGWAVGPPQAGPGFSELLSLLTDPDDTDASVQGQIPAEIWERISRILIGQFRVNAVMAREADRLGLR